MRFSCFFFSAASFGQAKSDRETFQGLALQHGVSFSFGVTNTLNLDDNIFQQSGRVLSLGYYVAYGINKKWSILLTGELDDLNYNFDAEFLSASADGGGAILGVASPERRFPRYSALGLGTGVYGRYHFKQLIRDNTLLNRFYLQGGGRLLTNLRASYSAAVDGERTRVSVREFVQPFAVQAELGVGFTAKQHQEEKSFSSRSVYLGVQYQASGLLRDAPEAGR
ncbi:hypothetical protein A3SI_13058 [Nitritalea halalkaliphila LW7]|uniref:Uncharacterized protein n=1 Tax=Nitritalea halalkaliphila LW7 TaxID=1189621 RepID=I5C170_9BACT|nr:hypothetical protein [Nitritalea halalkaliphila]EIM75572.1 hypothetical protein A3SI_13058 [Nitritalea halalkaliphila LW7]